MLSISEIKVGRVLQINNEPYTVIKADHHKMGRGGAVLKTKLRNLITAAVMERTWQGNEKAEKAQTEKRVANFMYRDDTEAYFMDNASYEQFSLSLDQLGDKEKFLKNSTDVTILYFQNKPVALELPIKITLAVIEAPPGVKGNTAGNVMKSVTLETGAVIQAPLFINQGDLVRINTETGEYAERV